MSVKGKKSEASFIPWNEFQKVIIELEKDGNYRFALIFAIGGYTGLLISDILTLRYESFNESPSLFVLEKQTNKKSGKIREITFNPELLKIIQRNKQSEKGFIFVNKGGKKIFSIQYVDRELKRIALRYNLDGNISSHSLRKTFGRHIWEINNESDTALFKLSKIFKHSNVEVTRHYLGIAREEISNVYLSLSL